MVGAIPEIKIEDNASKLADSIERVSFGTIPVPDVREASIGT
jgi:hypothetical protein